MKRSDSAPHLDYGLSYGAGIVNLVISHSDLFQVAVASGPGGWDPISIYLGGSRQRAAFAQWGLEPWPDAKETPRWHQLSAALNAEHVHAPLLVNAADREFRMGLEFYAALRQLTKPVEMFVYPNEFHEKTQPKDRFEIYERNVDWMRFWLQGYEDPAPEKSDQYRRWEILCDMQAAQDPKRSTFCVRTQAHLH